MDFDDYSSEETSSGSEYTSDEEEEEEEEQVAGNPFTGISDQRLAFLQHASSLPTQTPPPAAPKPQPLPPKPVAAPPTPVAASTPYPKPQPPSHQVNLSKPAPTSPVVQEKRRIVQEKAQAVENRISALTKSTTTTAPTTTTIPKPTLPAPKKFSTVPEDSKKMDDLVEKLASMEYRLKETTAEVESSKEKASQSEKEKNVFKNKAYDLAARLSALKKRLSEKEEETAKLETQNRDLDAKVNQLKHEVKSTETHLNKSYNDTLEGLTNHIQEAEKQINDLDNENNELRFKMTEAQRVCKYLQNKLTESEKNHASVTADTQFKMTEAQRVSRFLESKLNQIVKEKTAVEDKVTGLEDQVKKLKQEIGLKELVISQQNDKMKQKDAALADASRSILEVEGKLAASQKVCGFLESTLSKAETALQRRGPHPEAVKEINELKKKLMESNDLINTLNDGLSIARVGQKSMVDRVGGLEDQVTHLSCELGEKEEVARNLKTKWEIELERTCDLKEQIHKLKKVADDTRKDVKNAETEKQAMTHQLKSRVGDLEGNLRIFSSQVHELSSRVINVESEKKQWQTKAENLQGDLQKASSQVGELKTKVSKSEAEKAKWESRAQEMEFAMSDVANVEELQTQVSQVEKEKKDLENKAEVLQVQLATICDILREHKPEIAEMFEQEGELAGKAAAAAAPAARGGAGSFVQSMFGNKAVLAVTMAAAIVGVVVGDYGKHQPKRAFVTSMERDLVGAEFVPSFFEAIPEPLVAEMGLTELPKYEFEEGEVQEVVQEIAAEIAAEMEEEEQHELASDLDDDLLAEMKALDRVVAGIRSKKDKIWGKLQSMRKADINEDVFGLM